MMWIRGGSMMMKQQSTYARLQNKYWAIYKYGRLLLYQLYGMRRQEVRLRFIFYLLNKQQINCETIIQTMAIDIK